MPVTADGAVSAQQIAMGRFHHAVYTALDYVELATTAMSKAAEDRDKAETNRARRRADRALESTAREEIKVMCSLPPALVLDTHIAPELMQRSAAARCLR